MGYIDDIYWAAPFQKMVQVITYVQVNGPKYGYNLNLNKSTYLMSPDSNATTEDELENRIHILNSLGIPTSNVKIHPRCLRQTSSQLEEFRRRNWGFKVLGAFVGTDDYVNQALQDKTRSLESEVEVLLSYPNSQARCYLHKFCFNEKVNYWLRTQFPDHTKGLLRSFKSYQIRLIASYHGVYHKDEVFNQLQKFEDLYTRVAFKVEDGGMSLRSVQWVHTTAFLCSMAAALPDLAKVFPLWIQYDDRGRLIQVNEHASQPTSIQIFNSIRLFKQISLDSTFDEATSLTSIFQKVISLRPNEQQTSLSQTEDADQFYKPPKEKTLQKVCYDKMMKPALIAFHSQLQIEADSPGPNQQFAKTVFRNLLDVSNKFSGRWLFAGASQKSYIFSNQEFQASLCRRNTFVNKDIPQYSENIQSDVNTNYLCSCSGLSKPIDPYGYHLTSCKVGGGAIRLHNYVAQVLVLFLRGLGLLVSYEPTNMFADLRPLDGQGIDYRRPDILVHNPYGGGRKVIIEVAATTTNGLTRTSHHDTNRPLNVRRDQKFQKYANAAQALGCRLIICVVSYAGQIHHEIVDFVRGQIRHKIQIADGQDDPIKLKASVKHWSQQMSAAINREACRNITRKASQMEDKASLAQRRASAAIDSGDDFSHQSTQANDNYDNFDQTIMDLNVSQIDDLVYQAPQPANYYGVMTTEESPSQRSIPLISN